MAGKSSQKGGGGGGVGAVVLDHEQYGLSEEDVKKMVSDAVFFLLVADQKKSVIKRTDLMRTLELNKLARAVQEFVLIQASTKLLDVFGIKIVELTEKKGHYILVNQLSEANLEKPFLEFGEKETAQLGLNFTILGLIFMNNGRVSEDVLFQFLTAIGVENSEELAELYDGDIKKYINEILVSKQHYLRRTRIVSADKEYYEYQWGDRAEAEVKKSDVLKMVCQVYDCEPRMFKEHFEMVKEAEGLTDEDFQPVASA